MYYNIRRIVTGARNNNSSKSESSRDANDLKTAPKQNSVIAVDEKLNDAKTESVVLTLEKELKEDAQDVETEAIKNTDQLLSKSQNETTVKNATQEDSGWILCACFRVRVQKLFLSSEN